MNNHGGYSVSVFHTFHDEVDSYRTHVWECDGPCKSRAPFFGLVKRAMNRAPSKGDSWWAKHVEECGGTFTKIAEPEMSKEQVERLSALQRAGRQKNKIDGWIAGKKRRRSSAGADDGANRLQERAMSAVSKQRRMVDQTVSCPICDAVVEHKSINAHLDESHVA